jgi:hypothetical protein
VITVREYKFRAVVTVDPSARAEATRRLLVRARPHCVVQPGGGRWFPATISVRRSPSQGRPVPTVLRVRLLAGEPGAFLATGQPFTLWADAIVDDHAIRGEDRLGDGVITGHQVDVAPAASDHQPPRTPVRATFPSRRPTAPTPRQSVAAHAGGGR